LGVIDTVGGLFTVTAMVLAFDVAQLFEAVTDKLPEVALRSKLTETVLMLLEKVAPVPEYAQL
jgi:hypothetical protein